MDFLCCSLTNFCVTLVYAPGIWLHLLSIFFYLDIFIIIHILLKSFSCWATALALMCMNHFEMIWGRKLLSKSSRIRVPRYYANNRLFSNITMIWQRYYDYAIYYQQQRIEALNPNGAPQPPSSIPSIGFGERGPISHDILWLRGRDEQESGTST